METTLRVPCWPGQSWKRFHLPALLLLASDAIREQSLICAWPLLMLCRVTMTAQEDDCKWRSSAVSRRHCCAFHYACGFVFPFSPPPSCYCFQRWTLTDMEICPASLFFTWEIKFLRKWDFPWKIYTFQSNFSRIKPKGFLTSLRILFKIKLKRRFFSM